METIELEKIVYSLCIEDLQNVANEILGRELNADEVSILENKIGDYIDWYGAINNAILQNITLNK
ncbi:MAG: hypothetical protein A3C43_08460 [Candidatus Schekmanbacteria bacterium RIFCSPHIGHO2_02_FULL_38_11]|uniref:Uncharacterized protein n=1 Tax=Candidatus Schekmanbacteria bacterium RIFCSPLOWO2_12_FULL_38_15 TaxID=1817883 RepID=A0A1F7SEG7_9BACT|nr:MAG: hypothetical protein A3C43_08460 [Candidatus Schekmanbacteria bacterium RIFCSPHIGHO2_02_FULL_38_11]OGL49125.1 MAG: hypothetical protein A3H37_04105 [Candidatus Schekmanbacteria bacterium RIFCSPLOWO2_02_FULL_38_14]OGL52101.1 MAG: hypothetical protein A3G31_06690 [Candidatus Schekmanbacteria bacterium RIFCSPLOWO2_12_FULL_38_15]